MRVRARCSQTHTAIQLNSTGGRHLTERQLLRGCSRFSSRGASAHIQYKYVHVTS